MTMHNKPVLLGELGWMLEEAIASSDPAKINEALTEARDFIRRTYIGDLWSKQTTQLGLASSKRDPDNLPAFAEFCVAFTVHFCGFARYEAEELREFVPTLRKYLRKFGSSKKQTESIVQLLLDESEELAAKERERRNREIAAKSQLRRS